MKIDNKIVAMVAALGLCAGTAMAGAPTFVTNGNNAGSGSLRAALASGASKISIRPNVDIISIDSTLSYTGTEPLRIQGNGQNIVASGDFTLLESANGGNLALSNLNFQGIGGFNFSNAGTGKGIFVGVPTERSGVVRLELNKVEVMGVANHGIHVSDCTLGDDCGSGSGGGGEGSDASIHVILNNVLVLDAGNGKFDADGARVDERGPGGIVFQAKESFFQNVGADGVELDEGNDGDVYIDVRRSGFADNGGFCLPAPLDVTEPCVEDDDGELVLDLDDGFDIDEAGAGALLGQVIGSFANDNLDEGFDFDEEGSEGVDLLFYAVSAARNSDEGVKISSANAGDVIVDMKRMNVTANDNDGIQIEAEDGDGQVHVDFRNGISTGNSDDGLNLSQENETNRGTVIVRGNNNINSLDLENVDEV